MLTPARPRANSRSRPSSRPCGRGLRRIVSREAGSRASATAGRPSVTRVTVSTWTTVIGTPRPPSTAIAKSTISPRLAESRKATHLRTLSPIRRPSARARVPRERASGQTTRDEVHRQHLDDGHRNAKTAQHGDREEHDLAQVGREQEGDELALVVADPAALLDRRHDRGEVVVGEDDV